ncbi:MAG: Mur ligase family protein [Candidatus Saccharimonadales bacterium]
MKWVRYFLPNAAYKQVYMLQQLEYDPFKLFKWVISFPDLKNTVNRGKLILTPKALGLLVVAYLMWLLAVLSGVYCLLSQQYIIGLILVFISFDLTWLSIFTVSLLGKVILDAKRKPFLDKARTIFADTNATKIAVMGSYGKTSMKEILSSVLSDKFKVAFTPGNKNVPISHARWAVSGLTGDEEVLVVEYGEGEPGDISKLASLSMPNLVIMTGLAPNHLDHYKTYENLVKDFLDIENYTEARDVYASDSAKEFIDGLNHRPRLYGENSVDGWKISNILISINGTNFLMKKGSNTIKVKSKLLGRHNVGPLGLAVAIAFSLGMNKEEIEDAISKTSAFEHRMQPRNVNGAWIIDDTYNGNLEGFKAGLRLMSELNAKRKIYVTPGLVDQGEETQRVHYEIAKAIYSANPNIVVLMKNENTELIYGVLRELKFSGEVKMETNPLEYYKNIDQFIAAGDLILMQNDLPDAYS